MPRLPQCATAVLLSLSCMSSLAQVPTPPQYKSQVLQQYDRAGAYISVGAINNRGDIVRGYTSDSGFASYSSLVYAAGGGAGTTLPGAFESGLYDINDRGDVVGWSFGSPPDQIRHPVVNINSVKTQLDANGNQVVSASGINNHQQVAGTLTAPDGTRRGYIYQGGNYLVLGTLGGANSDASEINDRGQVLGSAQTSQGDTHPFLYEAGTMTDLTTLDGWRGWPTGFNDAGQIIGSFSDAEGSHAFFYADGQLSVIGLPGQASEAFGVNNLGQVVGFLGDGSFRTPFLWQDGQLYDLRTLFPEGDSYFYLQVGGINDLGQITLNGCGSGPWPAPQTCALLLLTPIPEPSEAAMLLAGLFIVACMLGHRKTSVAGGSGMQEGDSL